MFLDYASTLRAGQQLVPDMRLQAFQDAQADMQRQEFNLRKQQIEDQREQRLVATRQQQEASQALEELLRKGSDPSAVLQFYARFPEQAAKFKPLLDQMDADQKRDETTFVGTIYTRLRNNDVKGAADYLRRRVEADREAGRVDPSDEALLTALDSGDENEVRIATGMIGAQLAPMMGVDAFKTVYGGDEQKTETERLADYYEGIGRPELAEQVRLNKADPVVVGEPGAPIYRSSQFTGGSVPSAAQEGGDPSGSRVGANLDRMLAITVQSESGGNPNAVSPKGARGLMQVMPATGRDPGFGLRPSNGTKQDDIRLGREYFQTMLTRYGNDPAKAWAAYNAGPGALDKALLGGANWLSRMPSETRGYVAKNMKLLGTGGPVRVASRQQYDRLPSGTQYIAPDGSPRVKP